MSLVKEGLIDAVSSSRWKGSFEMTGTLEHVVELGRGRGNANERRQDDVGATRATC